MIHQRDGAFAAEQDALLLCRQRDALGGLHHLRGDVIQHLEELGLQFVLHIVHLGNASLPSGMTTDTALLLNTFTACIAALLRFHAAAFVKKKKGTRTKGMPLPPSL